jgi:N-acetylmuramoyl-L-alanine amidase
MRRDRRVRPLRSLPGLLGLLVLAAVPLACGSADKAPTPAKATAARTPEFSVSSTFSLPGLPTVGAPAAPTPSHGVVPRPSERPLQGRTIVLDAGHNGGNAAAPDAINRQVDAGGFQKACDTVGAQTNGTGYAEHAFTFDVVTRMTAVLRARGATVVLTRRDDTGVGPCVDQRAAIGNTALNGGPADVALSVHADGGPASGRGFHVIRPGDLPGRNDGIIADSRSLSLAVHAAMLSVNEPPANYIGTDGYDVRTDLGGLNLSTVPKVFVECGNMRNAIDAARLVDPVYRQQLAVALSDGLDDYLFGR